jgi:glutamate formiminotransferase
MQTIIECVPNFSEGRDAQKVEAIIKAILAGPEVYLLDKEMDADHHRSVVTFVGTRESVGEAALRGIGRAAELIDLNQHHGVHPRIGATDVVPFIPIANVTLEDCARIAEWVAEETWRRFRIPTYLYEAAARSAARKNLENIRRGQFEALREEIRTNAARRPDFGEAEVHPTGGATVVGARQFLIAYNINLNTSDVSVAKAIARKIRASGGGFPGVKAIGLELKGRNRAQVSINFTDFETTSIGTVYDAVAREAAARGVGIEASEIVGLVPRRALEDAAVHYLKVKDYRPELIFENRLERVRREQVASLGSTHTSRLRNLVEGFVREVAADKPAPGGGSVAALAGVLAAALGEMVCRVTLKRKSYAAHHQPLERVVARLTQLRQRLLENVDRDAASYEAVIAALRLPKATEPEQAARAKAVGEASKTATIVPLQTAELAEETAVLLVSLRAITLPQAASDLRVAEHLAETARRGAVDNVRTNLPSIHDRDWIIHVERRLLSLEKTSASDPPER